MIKLVNKILLAKMVEETNSSLPTPLVLKTDGIQTLPSFVSPNHIVYTDFCETTVLLLQLALAPQECKKLRKKARKLLLLQTLIVQNLKRLNLDSASKLIDRIGKEGKDLHTFLTEISMELDMHSLMMFLMGHEIQHAVFKYDSELLEKEIKDVAVIGEIYRSPHTFREKKLFPNAPEICSDKKLMEELACDKASIRMLARFIEEQGYTTQQVHEMCIHLVRFLTMIQFEKNLHELIEFKHNMPSLSLHVKNLMFDVMRVGSAAMFMAETFEPEAFEDFRNILISEVTSFDKVLSDAAKFGLRDWWLLDTMQPDKKEKDADKYKLLCQRFNEVSSLIGKSITNSINRM